MIVRTNAEDVFPVGTIIIRRLIDMPFFLVGDLLLLAFILVEIPSRRYVAAAYRTGRAYVPPASVTPNPVSSQEGLDTNTARFVAVLL
jgi:hypothetical protein